MRSSTSCRTRVAIASARCTRGTRSATRAAIRSPSCRRSPRTSRSIGAIDGACRGCGHDDAGAAARRVRRPVWPAADRVDCVPDGRLPVAAPGGAAPARRRAADSDEPGQYADTPGKRPARPSRRRMHELQHALAQQPVLNGDETGHRTNGAKRWLWTFVAPTFIFYTIADVAGARVSCGVCSARRLPASWAATACRRT